MRTLPLILGTFLFLCSGNLYAQTLEVADLEIGTNVEDRKIVQPDSTFEANVGSLFCFTRITGAQDTTEIHHVWYHDEEEMARTTLEVRSEDWRTWSSKTILPEWAGPWRVVIEDADGQELASQSFEITEND